MKKAASERQFRIAANENKFNSIITWSQEKNNDKNYQS